MLSERANGFRALLCAGLFSQAALVNVLLSSWAQLAVLACHCQCHCCNVWVCVIVLHYFNSIQSSNLATSFFFLHPTFSWKEFHQNYKHFLLFVALRAQAATQLTAMAQALWVVGAGTEEVNGKYDRVEDNLGKPQYRRKVAKDGRVLNDYFICFHCYCRYCFPCFPLVIVVDSVIFVDDVAAVVCYRSSSSYSQIGCSIFFIGQFISFDEQSRFETLILHGRNVTWAQCNTSCSVLSRMYTFAGQVDRQRLHLWSL